MQPSLLKGVIISHGENQRILAEALGITVSNLNAKINGTSSFRQSEILAIKTRYGLSAEEIDRIFFAD